MGDGKFDAVVVGAGFSGLYLVKRLVDAGFSVLAVEAAPGVGGTWYWNAYPGARCDVESFDYCYSFSKELEEEWTWSERYPAQPEILRYLNFVADRFDLKRHYRFSTRVDTASFDEAGGTWTLGIEGGDSVSCRWFILAGGAISAPKPPEYPGIEDYRGEWYLTAQWPHRPVAFKDKRVAVIGTGSSGIQTTTAIVDEVAELTVFQRTPNFCAPVLNRPLTEAEHADYRATSHERAEKARWSRQGIPHPLPTRTMAEVGPTERAEILNKAWDESHLFALRLTFADVMTNEETNETIAKFVRGKIGEAVKDPSLAEKLTPQGYPFAAKRPCIGKGYYEMFNRNSVRLVDLRETPILRFTANGIETGLGEMPFDMVIFATGFDGITGAATRIDITGRGGVKLRDKWAEGPQTYLGLMSQGFPNLFLVTGPLSVGPLSAMVRTIEQHVDFIVDCLEHMREKGRTLIEPRREDELAWIDHVREVAEGTLYPRADSWYVGANVPGKPRVFMAYLGGVGGYRAKCNEVVEAGYRGFEFN
jgi:cyclohexanone monooxygenase